MVKQMMATNTFAVTEKKQKKRKRKKKKIRGKRRRGKRGRRGRERGKRLINPTVGKLEFEGCRMCFPVRPHGGSVIKTPLLLQQSADCWVLIGREIKNTLAMTVAVLQMKIKLSSSDFMNE